MEKTLREKRIKEADKRIKEFASRPKSLEWAKEALSFCEREEEFGKDIRDESLGIQDLARIKLEAESIIEKDKKERQEIDKLIPTLFQGKISNFWCNGVENLIKRVENMSDEARLSLENLHLLEKLQRKLKYVQEALKIGDEISELRDLRKKDNAWAKKAQQIYSLVTDNNKEYIEEIDLLIGFNKQAIEIICRDEIEDYKQCLEKIEACSSYYGVRSTKDGIEEAQRIDGDLISKFQALDEKIGSISYDIEEHIDSFFSRWNSARKRINEAILQIEKAKRIEEDEKRAKEVYEKRLPYIEKYKKLLDKIERGEESTQVADELFELDKEIDSLDFDLNEYIHSFNSKWEKSKGLMKRAKDLIEQEERQRAIYEKRKPTINMYEQALLEISGEKIDERIVNCYFKLDEKLSLLDFDLGEYIKFFDRRWSAGLNVAKQEAEEQKKRRAEKINSLVEKTKAFLDKLGGDVLVTDCIEEFNALDKEISNLGVDLSENIDDFKPRWNGLRDEVNQEIDRIDEERKRLYETSRITKKVLLISGIAIVALAILGALISLCILVEGALHWVIAGVVCAISIALWIFINEKYEYEYEHEWLIVLRYIVSIIQLVIPVILLFFDGAPKIYAIGLSTGVLVYSLVIFIKDNENVFDFALFIASGVMLSVSIAGFVGGMVSFIIAPCGIAAFLIAGAIINYIINYYVECSELDHRSFIYFSILNIIGAVLTIALATFPNGELGVGAIILAVGVIASSIITVVKDDDCSWCIVLATIPAIVGLIMGIVCVVNKPFYSEKPFIDNGVLIYYTGNDDEFVIPDTVHTINEDAFNHLGPRRNLKSVVFHDNVTKIGVNAFAKCRNLESVTIPGGVEAIGAGAFSHCKSLESVTLEKGVVRIDPYAFYECDSLSVISLPSTLECIETSAFARCNVLCFIELPKGLSVIGECAFEQCPLVKIYIPDTVMWMGEGIFRSAKEHIAIYYEGTREQWEAIETYGHGWKHGFDAGCDMFYEYNKS